MSLAMSNDEIVVRYRQAKNKGEQVKILAELNDCSVEQIIGILVAGGIDHRCFSQLRRKQNQAAASAAEKVVKAEKKIPYKKPEIIPGPPRAVTLADAMAAIRAELDEINRQQYELDMRKGDLYKQLWDMIGGM